jgi:hypothetical protein
VITFAVVGSNEAAWLRNSLGQALNAARPEDRVWFVDSASTDGSAELAASLGVEVLPAPAGKGRAMAAALDHCPQAHVCFVDADIEASEVNIPRALTETLAETGADMVVAQFEWREWGFLAHTHGIFKPIVGRLFPEAVGVFDSCVLSGFRVVDPKVIPGVLPPGYGAEAHLDVAFAAAGLHTVVVDVGRYWGPVRPKDELAMEIAAAILDHAQELGRLDPVLRPAWDEWAEAVAAVVNGSPPGPEPDVGFRERVAAVASRPLPPAVVAQGGYLRATKT